jgi:hypothetical protein
MSGFTLDQARPPSPDPNAGTAMDLIPRRSAKKQSVFSPSSIHSISLYKLNGHSGSFRGPGGLGLLILTIKVIPGHYYNGEANQRG